MKFTQKVKQAVDSEEDEPEEFEEETETPEVPKNQKNIIKEKEHQAGDLEPIADIIGFRVWKNEKEFIEFGRDQEGLAILAQEIFKIAKIAQGN